MTYRFWLLILILRRLLCQELLETKCLAMPPYIVAQPGERSYVSGAGRMTVDEKYNINSVTRAVSVLRSVLERGSMPLERTAAEIGVSKSTAFRLLTTLQNEGLVDRAPGGGYLPGPELVRWALLMLGRLHLPTAAADALHELWLQTEETVGLGLVSGPSVVLATILESPAPFRVAEVSGTIVPLHSSALGHAVAAHLLADDLAVRLGEEPYEAITPTSPATFAALRAELDEVVRLGFAVDNEQSALGVACVAAPVFVRGKIAGAISVAGPRIRMPDDRLVWLGSQVAQVASRLSSELSLPDSTVAGADEPAPPKPAR